MCGCVAAVIRHSKCYLVFGLTYSLVSNYTHTYVYSIYIYRYFRYVETSLSGCCTQVVCWCHTICYLLMSFKVENKILHTHITTVRVFPPLTSCRLFACLPIFSSDVKSIFILSFMKNMYAVPRMRCSLQI